MQSPRVPEHVLRRQRENRPRPRPNFEDAIMPDPPADLPWYPRPGELISNLPGSLGRSFDAFASLISPQFIFDRGGWTEEQRAVGRLATDVAQLGVDRIVDTLHPFNQDPSQPLSTYPHLSQAVGGFVETTPLGSQGWRGFVDYLEQEPAELPLELVLAGAGRAITGARRLARAARPFDTDVFHRTDLLTGQRLPSAAEASVAIQTYRGARLLEDATGIRVGPSVIATASHVVAGKPGMPFSPTMMTARGLEGGQTGMIRGVQGILPEADIALLETADVSDAYLPLSDLAPGLSHEAVGDLGAGLETFGGVVGPNQYSDLATGAAIGETTLIGRGGLSGAGLVGESGEVSGIYLGELHQRGLFATGGTVSDFQRQVQGHGSVPVTHLQTGTITDELRNVGLHYRLARQGSALSPSPFLLGGLALHGRYGVQEPFSLVRLDPTRHREFEEGPMSGVFAYEGDLRDMLFEIKTPGLNRERRESLLEYLRSETELEYIPDVFREGGYDAITAVPSSIDRLRQRGFNQAEFYAEIFSDVLGIPFERDLLRRTRETAESSRLEGRLSREANLSGAFRADLSVAGQRILTVDDIVATGTTMRESLSALRAAGAEGTGGLAVASSLHNFMHPRAGLSRFSQDVGGSGIWSGADFTSSQERAISHLEGPAVISAVPGAGKTDVLVERVQQLMAGGVSPSEVLTVAYNRAAIEELSSRFEAAGLGATQARTVHSLAYEITMDPDNFTGVGFSHRPKIATDLTQERFRQMMRQYPDAQVDFSQSPSFQMAAAAETDADWLAAYQEYKRERGLLTFGQMLDVGAEILESQPDVRQRYLEKYPYLQVDEFQDISQREWNFLSKLTPNVLGVGDINQAIYGFRGATGDVMADLYQGATQYHLPETFRSTPEIFQTAQRLIGLNEQQIPVQGRSMLGSGSAVDFRPTTGDTIFDELEALLGSRHTDESTAVLVRTNREIKRILDTLGEEAFENVDIGTIHKGKGQGWDRVILPMETIPVQFGDSPEMIWSPRMRSDVDIENARRVGYVGLTRARQHAHVLGGGDLFEEMRTGERHLQLHGRSPGLREGFSYGFDRKIEGVPTLEDFNEFVQRHESLFLRATHGLEDTLEQQSLDWAQTLAVNMQLRERGVDIPIRGEGSALFPRSIYEAHQREIDYMVAPGSFIGESQWEPGMMGVFQQGVYGVKDLELLLKHAYWNPTPRLHMGGRELRLLQGQELKSGFQVSLPPDAQGFAPPGESIIKPERMLGLFDYEDIIDLGTGDRFRGQPMELEYELSRYGLEGLRPIDELEERLQLHGLGGTLGSVAMGAGASLGSGVGLRGLYGGWQHFLGMQRESDPELLQRSSRQLSGAADVNDFQVSPLLSNELGSDIKPLPRSVSEGVVRLDMSGSTGTGFFIDEGVIATNYHVIEKMRGLNEGVEGYWSLHRNYDLSSGERFPIRSVLGVDPKNDIALLGVDPVEGVKPLSLNAQDAAASSVLRMLGYPRGMGSEPQFDAAYYVDVLGDQAGKSEEYLRDFEFDVTRVYPGESGSPIFNEESDVIGILHSIATYSLLDDGSGYVGVGTFSRDIQRLYDKVKSSGPYDMGGEFSSDADVIRMLSAIGAEGGMNVNEFDINTVTVEELQRQPGISKGLAQRIISYRNVMGGFTTPDEILNVRGFREEHLRALRGQPEPYAFPIGHIPPIGTETAFPSTTAIQRPAYEVSQGLDINEATLQQLVDLRGIGTATAQRILESRAAQGEFPSLESLTRVQGIGEGTLNRLRPSLLDFGIPDPPQIPLQLQPTLPSQPLQTPAAAHRPQGTALDINTASAADFARLPTMSELRPEMTPEIAERIIDYRTRLGGFTSVDQLGHVSGISGSYLEDLQSLGRFAPIDSGIGRRDGTYQRPYDYPSDMLDHIPLGGRPDAPLYDSLSIEDVPLESGFEYSLRKFQERRGGATRFADPSSNDERSRRSRWGGRYRYTFGEGMGSEFEALPSRAAGHLFRHGTQGFADMLLDYPGEAIQRQGARVLENYASDALRGLARGEGLPGIGNYLGDTTAGLLEQGAPLLAPLALVAGTALIGESSLDANYADVIESASMRKQRFYDRFREKPLSHTVEVGGKISTEAGGLERFIESIVKRVLAEGADDISDKLVTRIGRKVKLQMQRGQL